MIRPEAEKTVSPPEPKPGPAQEFYFPAGGGADPDFFLPSPRKNTAAERIRLLKSRLFGRGRAGRAV